MEQHLSDQSDAERDSAWVSHPPHPPLLPPVSSRSPSLTPPLAAGAFEISLQRAGFGRCSSSFHRKQRVGRARAEVALASAEDAGMKAAGGFPSSTALLLPSPST